MLFYRSFCELLIFRSLSRSALLLRFSDCIFFPSSLTSFINKPRPVVLGLLEILVELCRNAYVVTLLFFSADQCSRFSAIVWLFIPDGIFPHQTQK